MGAIVGAPKGVVRMSCRPEAGLGQCVLLVLKMKDGMAWKQG